VPPPPLIPERDPNVPRTIISIMEITVTAYSFLARIRKKEHVTAIDLF
jgi:hypothetical protein